MPTKTSKPTVAKKGLVIPQTPPTLSSALPHHSHWRGEWLWVLAPAFVAALGWWAAIQHILEPSLRPDQLGSSLWLTIGAIVAFAFFAGTVLIIPNIVHYRWVYPAMGLALGLPGLFFFGFSAASAIAGLILATGIWAAAEGAGRESITRLRLDMRTTLAHVVPWIVVAATVSIALLQYDISRRSGESMQQVDRLIERTVSAVETLGPKFIDNFDPSITVDQLLGAQIPSADDMVNEIMSGNRLTAEERAQFIEQVEALDLQITIPAVGASAATVRQALARELDESRGQIIDEFRSTVGKQLGIKLQGEETVHQALVKLVGQRTGIKSAGFAAWLPPIISFGLFLALRLLSPLFNIAAIAAGLLWYRGLRLAHVITVAKVPQMAERLRWGPG